MVRTVQSADVPSSILVPGGAGYIGSHTVRALRAAGREIVDLSAGQPDFPSPAVAVEAARKALAEGFTRYTTASGIPELRRALARRYAERCGAPWGLDNVLVTVGAKAALFELIQTLVDEGDEAVLPAPAWVSFPEQIRLAGGRPVLVETEAAEGFAIRAAPLLDAVTDRTRLILVNSPSNPTGKVYTEREFREIGEVLCEHPKVLIACDAIYEFIYWCEAPFRTFLNA